MRAATPLTTVVLLATATATIVGIILPATGGSFPGRTAESAYVPAKRGTLNYTAQIQPIIAAHCAGCHHPGEVAPFPLLSYSDVKKRAQQIVDITTSHAMPPWKANSHGEFQDENRLTPTEIGELKQWTEEGTAEGKRSADIAIGVASSEWRLGKPDVILAPAKPFTLAAEGRDDFHTYILPTNFTEDVYLSGIEVKPGNRKIVHHTVLYADTDGRARRKADAAGAQDYPSLNGAGIPQGVVDIWTPGKLSRRLPDGIGMLVPKGTALALEIHYHRSGKPEPDTTRVALYLCKGVVKQRLRVYGLAARRLFIPAGEASYKTEAQMQVPENVTVYSIFPHMHLLGRQMKVDIATADGSNQTLIDVPDWDFNWQNTYLYNKPVKMGPGTTIHMSAVYDNSVANPRNPNSPPKFVTWGEQTTDEMSLVFFGYTVDRENIPAGVTVPDWPTLVRGR